MTAQSNTMWQARVKLLLREGFGAEGIAIITGSSADDVRREIEILRASGELKTIYRRKSDA